jgi:hypothetical protein
MNTTYAPTVHDVTTQAHADNAWYATCACGWYSIPCFTESGALVAAGNHHEFVAPKKSRKGWIAGGLGLLLVVALAAAGGASDSTSSDTDANPVAGDSAASMSEWASRNSDDFGRTSGILSDIGESASSYDVDGMVSGCRRLQSAVVDAQESLPAPDATVNLHYSRALSLFYQAAHSCILGGTTLDADALGEAATSMSEAGDELQKASAAMPG